MTTPHPLLQFGDIDAALLAQSDKTGRSLNVCIYKSTLLQNKDRVACQVFDGGTAYERPAEGVAYGVRLVMRAQAMDLSRIKDGLIVRLGPDTIVHSLKSGEKVFDCYQCDIVEEWPGMRRSVVNVINNPLTKPGAPQQPVYNPHAASRTPVASPAVSPTLPPSLPSSTTHGNTERETVPSAPARDQMPPRDVMSIQAPRDAKPTAPPRVAEASDSGSYGPERGNRAPVVQRSDPPEPYAPVRQRPSSAKYLKIADLTNYVDKWRILARVTNRSEVKEYRNARGDGKLFSVDLIDSEGVEIKATFFNEAVDRFSPLLRKNGVFSFSKGQIKPVNMRFKKFDHLYELTFGLDAEIEEEQASSTEPSAGGIPLASLKPRSLAEVETVDVDSLLDIVALCYQVYETSQITIRSTGNRKDKRTVQAIDQSGVIVPLTLWGSDCALLPAGSWSHKQAPGGDCEYYLAVKKAKVDEFNGRKLSTSMGTVQVYRWEPGCAQWHGGEEDAENIQPHLVPTPLLGLRDWVNTQKQGANGLQGTRASGGSGGGGGANAVKQYHSIADMLNECQSMATEQLSSGAYFNIFATIIESNITPHRKFFWAACGACGKKLQGGPDTNMDSIGMSNMSQPYTCGQCDITVNTPDRKYNFALDIQDHTNSVKLSVLGDCGKELFDGKTANELEDLKTHRGTKQEGFEDVVQNLRRQEMLFKIVARNETWQDETRIKYRLIAAQKLIDNDGSLVSYLQKQRELIDNLMVAAPP